MTRARRSLHLPRLICLALLLPLAGACASARGGAATSTTPAPSASGIPRTADGRPNLSGIWQVRNRAAYGLEDHAASYLLLPGSSVVEGGGPIPYTPEALKQRNENYLKRAELDPLAQCYMPGVPRIMYMEHPFQIFQTPEHLAMTFEWSQVFRLIYTNGSSHQEGIEFWMGDSRGRWEGDTLVVDVKNHNDRTWLDAAGNFHSEEMHLVERYTMRDADTLEYRATIEDPKTFSQPWTIVMPFYRHKDMTRLLEYQCQAEREEDNGDFERDERTWYPRIPNP